MQRSKMIFARFVAGLMLSSSAWADTPSSEARDQSQAATAVAEIYIHAQEWDAARKQLETALTADSTNVQARQLLTEVIQRQHEEEANPLKRLANRFAWWFDLLAAIVFVLLLYLLLKFIRWCRTLVFRARAPKGFVLRSFVDATNTGAGDLAWSALLRFRGAERRTSEIAGLLNVQPSQTAEQVVRLQPELASPELSLKDLDLKIGTIGVEGVGQFLDTLAEWFAGQLPAITGSASASSDNSQISVCLTYTDNKRARMKATVVGSASGPDGALSASESAAFQMYYLLSHPEAEESTALAHDKIRQGLVHLREYADGFSGAALQEALKDFSFARTLPGSPHAAMLYEGVTLDLLERHEDAIARFRLIAQRTSPGLEHDTAVYNQATAQLRRYRHDSLIAAESLYSSLITPDLDVLNQPIRELAKVGLANVYAHKPIFWQALLHDGRTATDAQQAALWWEADRDTVIGWANEVLALAEEIDADLKLILAQGSSKSAWDETGVQQLRWGRWNAVGNVFLYLAINFLSEAPHHLTNPRLQYFEKIRQRYLELSLAALRQTERIGIPGVETLTNVGSVLLALGRFDEARHYFERAIDINPEYEYAYFRTAESWVKEGDMDAAKAYLAGYDKPPRIARFRELFKQFDVPMKQ